MKILRTPEHRFDNLPNFNYQENFLAGNEAYHNCRIHYLDEGPKDAPLTWLCLHGEPSWSYLYRKMIPVFTTAGHRVIAPDLIGFGKSDKPDDDDFYTFAMHRNMLLSLVDELRLQNIALVCQDWGGLLGLTLPMENPSLYHAVLIMNTALGTGDIPLGEGFTSWRSYVKKNPDLDVGALMRRSTPFLSAAEAAAYAAPFPDQTYKAGVRKFPELVPEHFGDPGGMQDPVLGEPAMRHLHQSINGCPEPIIVNDGGHFLQEWGVEIALQALQDFS